MVAKAPVWTTSIFVTRFASESPALREIGAVRVPLVNEMGDPPLTEYVAVPVVNTGSSLMVR